MAKQKDSAKAGRNAAKCARYRARTGKPLGPGVEGTRHGSKRRKWQEYRRWYVEKYGMEPRRKWLD